MTLLEAIDHRHSIRCYIDKPLAPEDKEKIAAKAEELNKESGLSMSIMFDEPKAFEKSTGFLFTKNYVLMTGPVSMGKRELQEAVGYYGEKLVLWAETEGFGTCWVKASYKKQTELYNIPEGHELVCVIAIGYPAFPGKPHQNRLIDDVIRAQRGMPQWYIDGAYAALAAPTALNQQMFYFVWKGENRCQAKPNMKIWPNVYIDLGIVKYHFEIGAGAENFVWVEE